MWFTVQEDEHLLTPETGATENCVDNVPSSALQLGNILFSAFCIIILPRSCKEESVIFRMRGHAQPLSHTGRTSESFILIPGQK